MDNLTQLILDTWHIHNHINEKPALLARFQAWDDPIFRSSDRSGITPAGRILLTARQCGYKLPEEFRWGIWDSIK